MRRRSIPLVVALAIAALGACSAPAHPQSRDVAVACDHLRSLGCDLAQPTPQGATCDSWLGASACGGDAVAACVDIACTARAATCAEADGCGR